MSEPHPNDWNCCYLSMMHRAWSGCLEIPIEWLGRSDSELPSELYTYYGVSNLLQSLGEEQIKSINVKEQTLRMLDAYDPLPDFMESIMMPEDIDERVQVNTLRTLARSAILMKFPSGARTDPRWSLTSCMTIHIMAFFTNISGTMNRESTVGKPFRDKTSKDASEMEFAVLINRYGSRPHLTIYNFAHEYPSPSLADQSLNRAFTMQITQTHPALVVGKVEAELLTPMNRKRILESLVPLTEPSLRFLVDGWHQYCLQNVISMDQPFPPWLILFSLIVNPEQVTIIAHYPASPNLRAFNSSPGFSSLVLDSIHSHLSVQMSPRKIWENPLSDTTWIYDRLRLGMALLRILKSSRHILCMWDELRWSSDTLLWEEEYDKKVANIKWRTPNPSENAEDMWAESLSPAKRKAFEREREDIRIAYEVYYGDEMDMDMLTTDGDDDNSKVLENLVRESIERVSLWLEGLPKDKQQFHPL